MSASLQQPVRMAGARDCDGPLALDSDVERWPAAV